MNEQAVLPTVNLLRQVLSGYCKYPLDLTVRLEGCRVIVHPHIVDYPRIIGKDGRFVNAFAAVLAYLSNKAGCQLKLVTKNSPNKGKPESPSVVPYNERYELAIVADLLDSFLRQAGDTEPHFVVNQVNEVKIFTITPSVEMEGDGEFFDHLSTIFAGFGRFQGVGDIQVKVVEPAGGGSGLEGGSRCLPCAAEGQKGLAPC